MRGRTMVGLGLLAATAALTAVEALPAQSLAARVEHAPDGPVHFHFQGIEGVCGHENGIGIRKPGTDDWTLMRWNVRRGGDRDEIERLCEPGPVRVELTVRGGRVTEVDTRAGRAGEARGTDLGRVNPADAATYLLDLARGTDEEVGEDALLPAALAGQISIHPQLMRLAADRGVPAGTRAKAVFWAAERDVPTNELVRLYGRADHHEIKESVLFAFGRREDPAAAAELLRVARSREPTDLREKAVFWLGQSAGRAVTRDLGELAVDESTDEAVREHAVFALSRRPPEEGIPALLRIARSHASPNLRRKAMFWLAESGDPRAIALFEEILIPRR